MCDMFQVITQVLKKTANVLIHPRGALWEKLMTSFCFLGEYKTFFSSHLIHFSQVDPTMTMT